MSGPLLAYWFLIVSPPNRETSLICMRVYAFPCSVVCVPRLLQFSSLTARYSSTYTRGTSSSIFSLVNIHQSFDNYSTMSECAVKLNELNWVDLRVPSDEMLPENTLNMGQCFHWKPLLLPHDPRVESSVKYWIGVIEGVPLLLRQLPHTTEATNLYTNLQVDRKLSSLNKFYDGDSLKSLLQSYFQIEDDLSTLYGEWSQCCNRMEIVAQSLRGVRVVRQDPWECLVSFICSSNNNISRITLMLDRLRTQFGRYLCSVRISQQDDLIVYYNDDKLLANSSEMEYHLYSFPTVARLASLDEQTLRDLGMGYRARFLVESAKLVQAKSREMLMTTHSHLDNNDRKEDLDDIWLRSLRQHSAHTHLSEEEKRCYIQEQLLLLPGVGRKVADCVALFSLDQSEAIPVDTHVWSIAIRDYAPHLRHQVKSLTPTVYDQVGDVFRNLFQRRAGWAHSVLFAAELPNFRNLLPLALQEEMKQFILQQKQGKTGKKLSLLNKQKKDVSSNMEEIDLEDSQDNARSKKKKSRSVMDTNQSNNSQEVSTVIRQRTKKSRV